MAPIDEESYTFGMQNIMYSKQQALMNKVSSIPLGNKMIRNRFGNGNQMKRPKSNGFYDIKG